MFTCITIAIIILTILYFIFNHDVNVREEMNTWKLMHKDGFPSWQTELDYDTYQEDLRYQFARFLKKDNHSFREFHSGNLIVQVDLYIGNAYHIKQIPDSTYFNGYLDVRNGSVILGKNITIDRFLDLKGTPTKSLPEGLKIGECLDIRGTQISELPDDLEVEMNIFALVGQLTKIQDKFKDKIMYYKD